MNTAIKLETLKTAAATGRQYFEAKLPIIGRDILVLVNPRWKVAQDEAIRDKTTNKQPSFNILVKDMQRAEGSNEGTGATWARSKGKHSGNFEYDGQQYAVAIVRPEGLQTFELTFEKIEPVDLNDL